MCKVCFDGLSKLPQHCLFECAKTKYAWEAYFRVWQQWGAPNDVALSWPFILLSDLVVERKDDPPKIQDYHDGGFSFISQPLDILRNFILYFLWSEGVGCTLMRNIPPTIFSNKLGSLLLTLGWRPAKPSIPLDLLVSLVFRIILIRPLRLNGAT
jgi:hypothetical protein